MELTAKEIAEKLGISRRAVAKRAQKEKWSFVEVKSSRGKKQKKYVLKDLPEDVRESIIGSASSIINGTKNGTDNIKEKQHLNYDNGTNNGTNTESGCIIQDIDNIKETHKISPQVPHFAKNAEPLRNRKKSVPFQDISTTCGDFGKSGLRNQNGTSLQWLTVATAAFLEGVSERTIRKRIVGKEYSKVRFVNNRWLIHVSDLSIPAQKRYYENIEAGNDLDVNLLGKKGCTETRAEALVKYNKAPEKARTIAHARARIIKEFRNYNGKVQDFPSLYNNRRLDFDNEVYSLVEKISLPTLYRWLDLYDREGIAGLVPQLKRDTKPRTLTEEMQAFIIACIEKNPQIRAKRVRELLEYKFGSAPHHATIWRFMERWKEENAQLYSYLCNPAEWRSKYQVALGRKDRKYTRFCQCWEIDTTPGDIICADGRRYKIIGLIDVFTRKAMVLVSKESTSIAIASLLRRAMTEWGIPEEIVKDNGKDYTSKHIEAICEAFEIETPFVPPFTPEAKPFIERFFRTLAHGLAETLPGYIGHNVAERQAIRERERWNRLLKKNTEVDVKLDASEFQEICDKWIKTVYEQTVHRGIGKRPVEMVALSDKTVRRVQDERVLDILLAPVGEATVQKKGIQFNGTYYVSLEQGEHVGKRIQVRQDLTDASKLYVFDNIGRYLFTAIAEDLANFSVEEITIARKRQRKIIRRARRALAELEKVAGVPGAQEVLDNLEKQTVAEFARYELYTNDNIKEIERALEGTEREEKEREAFEHLKVRDEGVLKLDDFKEQRNKRPVFMNETDWFFWFCDQLKSGGAELTEEDWNDFKVYLLDERNRLNVEIMTDILMKNERSRGMLRLIKGGLS